MVHKAKILVIAPRTKATILSEFIAQETSFAGRLLVKTLYLETKLTVAKFKTSAVDNTLGIIRELAFEEYEHVILFKDLPVDVDEVLGATDVKVRLPQSQEALLRDVKDALYSSKLHWLPHAQSEWEKSSIQSLNPLGFLEQFSRLGFGTVGKAILKALKVIDDAAMRAAFSIDKDEATGLRVGHCFFSDVEKGSSSGTVQNVLEHLYPGEIHKLNTNDLDHCFLLDVDRLYLYEDGLWSGVELVRRLNALSSHPRFEETAVEFHFKFAATSDVGLSAARIFSRSIRTSRFQFSPSKHGAHYSFLRSGVDTGFPQLLGLHVDQVRSSLDALTEPYAFRDPDLWAGHVDKVSDAVRACEDIGRQLMTPFLFRKATERAGQGKPEEDLEVAASQGALGAMGYASTVLFSSSVPKPVLPLLWLQGNVKVGDRSVNWRPLFWDVRRTGEYQPAPEHD